MKIRKSKVSDAKGIANVLYQSYNIEDIKEGIEVFKTEAKKRTHAPSTSTGTATTPPPIM